MGSDVNGWKDLWFTRANVYRCTTIKNRYDRNEIRHGFNEIGHGFNEVRHGFNEVRHGSNEIGYVTKEDLEQVREELKCEIETVYEEVKNLRKDLTMTEIVTTKNAYDIALLKAAR